MKKLKLTGHFDLANDISKAEMIISPENIFKVQRKAPNIHDDFYLSMQELSLTFQE